MPRLIRTGRAVIFPRATGEGDQPQAGGGGGHRTCPPPQPCQAAAGTKLSATPFMQ